MSIAAALVVLHLAASARPVSPALTALADGLAADVLPAADPPIAVAVSSDAPELADAVQTLLASRLAAAKLSPIPLRVSGHAAEAEARRMGAHSLVRLRVVLSRTQLLARGDVLGTWVNFWAGSSPTRPLHPARPLLVSVPADAALLDWTIQGPLQVQAPVALRLDEEPLARLPAVPLALAAGDLDGDGKDEVVVLTRDELQVRSLDGKQLFVRDLRAQPPSETPARDAFGALLLAQGAEPAVGYLSSALAAGEWLRVRPQMQLEPQRETSELPLCGDGSSARLTPGENTLSAKLPGAVKERALSACAAAQGPDSHVEVAPSGEATWDGAPLAGLGAAAALIDLDGTGQRLLVAPGNSLSPRADELQVWTRGQPIPHRALEVPGRILQVVRLHAVSPTDAVLLLGVELPDGSGELLRVRRQAP